MKKIFYFIASAIVALGAMACQNEVDENITPENTNEISFTVSFDESTRVEGTVDDKNKTASFKLDGNETLTVGGVELSYDKEKEVFVATRDEDKATLNGLIDKPVTATVVDNNYGLEFESAEFELAQENEITVSLACPALYFTVPADTTVVLTINEDDKEYTAGNYFLGIEGTTAAISYAIGGVECKNVRLSGMTNKVYNLGELNTNLTVANIATMIEKAEAGSIITLPAGATITGSEILTIDKSITINGNGATFTSTAGRAINVSGDGVEVTISNLNIECTGERGVNVIQNAKSVTLNEVNITAANYAVNVASSAPGAQIAITNSTLHGLCTVNVASLGANVTLDKCTVYCDDNNTTAGEDYAALSLGMESEGGSIIATNTEIHVAEDSDSFAGRNSAKNGTVTINGSEDDVCVVVAVITYDGPNYHDFANVDAAIEFNAEQDNVGTIVLIRDAKISTVGTFKIDVNGCNLTADEGYKVTIEGTTVTVAALPVIVVDGTNFVSNTINIYVWEKSSNTPINGAWPGKDVNKADNKFTYTIPEEYVGKEIGYVVNIDGNDGKKSGDQVITPAYNTTYTFTGPTEYHNGWFIAGPQSSFDNMPGDWDPANGIKVMYNWASDENYVIVTTKVDNAEFKLTKGTWDENLGGSFDKLTSNGANLKIAEIGTYKLVIDYTNKKLTATKQ